MKLITILNFRYYVVNVGEILRTARAEVGRVCRLTRCCAYKYCASEVYLCTELLERNFAV